MLACMEERMTTKAIKSYILAEEFWCGLTEEEQIQAAVVIFRRLTQHAKKRSSFRHLLYEELGWSAAAYSPVYAAGGMRIASEIVKAAEEKHGNARYGDIDTITASAEEWETIIAAKLEPIRDALQMMWNNPESMTPGDILAQYTAACEMLEDEGEPSHIDVDIAAQSIRETRATLEAE